MGTLMLAEGLMAIQAFVAFHAGVMKPWDANAIPGRPPGNMIADFDNGTNAFMAEGKRRR
jgi:hypothetical protein